MTQRLERGWNNSQNFLHFISLLQLFKSSFSQHYCKPLCKTSSECFLNKNLNLNQIFFIFPLITHKIITIMVFTSVSECFRFPLWTIQSWEFISGKYVGRGVHHNTFIRQRWKQLLKHLNTWRLAFCCSVASSCHWARPTGLSASDHRYKKKEVKECRRQPTL